MKSKNTGLKTRIELRMWELNISQKKLVELTDLRQSALSHIQTGRTQMVDAVTIFKLADALQCDPRWLANGGVLK